MEFQLTLINDWVPDNPVTVAVKALLPGWHGEQAGLPDDLIERGVAVAAGRVRAASDCQVFCCRGDQLVSSRTVSVPLPRLLT